MKYEDIHDAKTVQFKRKGVTYTGKVLSYDARVPELYAMFDEVLCGGPQPRTMRATVEVYWVEKDSVGYMIDPQTVEIAISKLKEKK